MLYNKFITYNLLLVFLLALPCHAHTPTQPIQQKMPVEQKSDDGHEKITIPSRIVSALILLACLNHTHSQTKEVITKQLKPINLLKNLAYNTAAHFNATLWHEIGHAVTAKFFTKEAVSITIGSKLENNQQPLLNDKLISINNLDFHLGETQYYPNRNMKQWKKICISLSGGIAGIIGNFFFKLITNYLQNTDNVKKALCEACSLDSHYMCDLSNIFIPFSENCDAASIYKELSIPINRAQEEIALFNYLVQLAGSTYITIRETTNEKISSRNTAIITFINNTLLNNYVRFHL